MQKIQIFCTLFSLVVKVWALTVLLHLFYFLLYYFHSHGCWLLWCTTVALLTFAFLAWTHKGDWRELGKLEGKRRFIPWCWRETRGYYVGSSLDLDSNMLGKKERQGRNEENLMSQNSSITSFSDWIRVVLFSFLSLSSLPFQTSSKMYRYKLCIHKYGRLTCTREKKKYFYFSQFVLQVWKLNSTTSHPMHPIYSPCLFLVPCREECCVEQKTCVTWL